MDGGDPWGRDEGGEPVVGVMDKERCKKNVGDRSEDDAKNIILDDRARI